MALIISFTRCSQRADQCVGTNEVFGKSINGEDVTHRAGFRDMLLAIQGDGRLEVVQLLVDVCVGVGLLGTTS